VAQVKTPFGIVIINEVCKERAVGPGKDDIEIVACLGKGDI
jgi:hypothetical protein